MLHVRMLSGEEVACVEVEDLSDARALKQRLNQLHDFPSRFRQRLFCGGSPMCDAATLDAHMGLELVLLSYAEQEADELLTAAANGSKEEVETLLQRPLHPDLLNDNGESALMRASAHGHVGVLPLLLEAGADRDLSDNRGRTALRFASRDGRADVVEFLLEAGVHKDLACNAGGTALMAASHFGHVEVVRLLLEAGADMNLAMIAGNPLPPLTALIIACEEGHVEVLRMLLEAGADKDFVGNGDHPALITASERGHADVVCLLLEAGADKNCVCNQGYTSLMLASGHGHVEVVRLLVEAGADMNLTNYDGDTALILASAQGHVEVARLLLEAGADKDLGSNAGYTPLMRASYSGHMDVVRLLLEAGADMNLTKYEGNTALIWASGQGHVQVVRLLLETCRNRDGLYDERYSALMEATDQGHVTFLHVLQDQVPPFTIIGGSRVSAAGGRLDTGSLVLWLLPQHALRLAAWLSEWEGRSHGSHEGNFWRQRMIVAMKKRLESAAFDEPPRGGAPAADFRVYSVHQARAEAPLAIAAVSDRPFPLEPLGALHVDAIVTQPDASARGLGAVLLRCLVQQAAAANQVLVLEPQSAGLEAYFTRLGFQHIEELDPYLWVPSGALPGRDVDVRYVLVQDEDYQRLVAAFKRPPAWTGDTAALDVMALRVSSQGTSRRAFARRMQREAPGQAYKAGDVEDVDPAEDRIVMAIMRGPEKLEEVDWACAQDFGGGSRSSLPGHYSGLGRCSVSQKAFPLPGLLPAYGKADLVIESLELQMRTDPVYSVSICCKVGALAEVLDISRNLFSNFRVRAVLHRNPVAWDLEVVQSDGLAYAAIQSQQPPGDEKKSDDMDIF
eukprot:s1069_g10.t3